MDTWENALLNQEMATCQFSGHHRLQDVTPVKLPAVSKRRHVTELSDLDDFSPVKSQEQFFQCTDIFKNQMGNLHMGAFDLGMKLKNVLMNNPWISRGKPGGSASVTAAKSHLSDTASSSSKCLSPLGEKASALKRGHLVEMTQGKKTL
uniref:Uncharacterized protein n=1 Tax=Sphaerodactylus townsendi TaxID=933632 RepID=A0ACB8E6J3_9SAUR